MRLPVTEAVFLQESAALLDDLFHQTDGRPAAVNQGGSFWRPESSTQYYGDRRVIVVTRDVRDVFAEARTLSLAFPGGDVKAFAAWYSRMMAFVSADEWNSPVVMHIEFEQFVTQFARERARLDAFLGLDPAAPSSYDAERSRRNIGRFRDVLAPGEIAYLEAELPEHIRR